MSELCLIIIVSRASPKPVCFFPTNPLNPPKKASCGTDGMLAKKVVGKSEKYVKELFLLLSYQPVARYLLVAGVSDNLHRETFVTLLRNFGENFIGFANVLYI